MFARSPFDRVIAALDATWGAAEPAFAAVDLRGRFLYGNGAFDRLVGFRCEAFRGRMPPLPYWDPDSTPDLFAKLAYLMSGQWEALKTHSIEATFRHADGRPIEVVCAVAPLRHQGELVGWGGPVLRQDEATHADAEGVFAVTSALHALRERMQDPDGYGVPSRADVEVPYVADATRREREVLSMLLRGFRTASIARRLGVSSHTVRNHLKGLFRKTDTRSQKELIHHCRHRAGLAYPGLDLERLAASGSPLAAQRLALLVAREWGASPQPAFCHDWSVRRLYSNPAFDRLVGYSSSDLAGRRPPHPYWDPSLSPVRDSASMALVGSLGVRSVVQGFRSASGRSFEVLVTGGRIRDRDGNGIGAVNFVFELEPGGTARHSLFPEVDAARMHLRRQVAIVGSFADSGIHTIPRNPVIEGWEELTRRERQVAAALGHASRVGTIAEQLGLSVHTVRNHLRAIFRKTGIRTQEELALKMHESSPAAGLGGLVRSLENPRDEAPRDDPGEPS